MTFSWIPKKRQLRSYSASYNDKIVSVKLHTCFDTGRNTFLHYRCGFVQQIPHYRQCAVTFVASENSNYLFCHAPHAHAHMLMAHARKTWLIHWSKPSIHIFHELRLMVPIFSAWARVGPVTWLWSLNVCTTPFHYLDVTPSPTVYNFAPARTVLYTWNPQMQTPFGMGKVSWLYRCPHCWRSSIRYKTYINATLCNIATYHRATVQHAVGRKAWENLRMSLCSEF